MNSVNYASDVRFSAGNTVPAKSEAQNKPKPVKNRMPEQDISKGLMIVAVLFLHSITLYTVGAQNMEVTTASSMMLGFIGFAMPAFFVLSGYNYSYKGLTYGKCLLKKVQQIISPLLKYTLMIWVIMGTYMIVRNEMTFKQAVNSFFGYWITDPLAGLWGFDASKTLIIQTVGPTWFLKALFSGSVLFLFFAPKIYNRTTAVLSVSMFLLCVSAVLYSFDIELPWFFESSPEIAALMFVGYLMKKVNIFDRPNVKRSWMLMNVLVFFAFSLFLQINYYKVGTLAAGEFEYGYGAVEVVLAPIYGFLGAYSMIILSRFLIGNNIFSRYLEWFGQRTMLTLIFHGSIMRFLADVTGVTGGEPKLTYRNIIIFVGAMVLDSLLLLAIDKLRELKNKKKRA